MNAGWPAWLQALMFATFVASLPQSGASMFLALAALLFVGVARQDYQAGAHPLTMIK